MKNFVNKNKRGDPNKVASLDLYMSDLDLFTYLQLEYSIIIIIPKNMYFSFFTIWTKDVQITDCV